MHKIKAMAFLNFPADILAKNVTESKCLNICLAPEFYMGVFIIFFAKALILELGGSSL